MQNTSYNQNGRYTLFYENDVEEFADQLSRKLKQIQEQQLQDSTAASSATTPGGGI